MGMPLLNLIGIISAVCSIAGVYLELRPHGTFSVGEGIAIGVFSTFFLIVIISEIATYRRAHGRIYKDEADNKRYMQRWIQQGARTVIVSRDMSWVDEPIKRLLLEKARKNELVLFAQSDWPICRELSAAGADVRKYGDLGWQPRTRFTIINYGRHDEKVAVGLPLDKGRRILEFSQGQHPFLDLARDFIPILTAASTKV
jgi:hypothetical protein